MKKHQRLTINLESLLDFSANLNEVYEEELVYNYVLLTLMGKLRILRACVLEVNNDENQKVFKPVLFKGKGFFSPVRFFDIKEFKELSEAEEGEKQLYKAGYKYCFPVTAGNNLECIICLGGSYDNNKFHESEIQYINLLANITAKSLQTVKKHKSLIIEKNNTDKHNQLLSALFEFSNDFSGLLSHSQILKMLSFRIMGQLMVSRFALYLLDEQGKIERITNRLEGVVRDNFIFELLDLKHAIEVAHLKSIPLRQNLEENGVVMVSPMIAQGKTLGILAVGKKMNGEHFTDDNRRFIEALSNTAMSALENERLFQEALEKKRLESEMELAFEIQKNLLPNTVPILKKYQLAGMSIPSRMVGGDYYDFVRLDENKLLIAIADVSGKGIPAAILMANVQAALRVLAPLKLQLKELVSRINSLVYHNTTPDKFVTMFFALLDEKEGTIEFINAGHNPPFLLRQSGKFELLTEGGIILGFSDNLFEYLQGKISLQSGDVIVFYTDGVTEALNKEKEEYDEERLQRIIIKSADKNATSVLNSIMSDVDEFVSGFPQYDDITLVVLKAI